MLCMHVFNKFVVRRLKIKAPLSQGVRQSFVLRIVEMYASSSYLLIPTYFMTRRRSKKVLLDLKRSPPVGSFVMPTDIES